MTTLVFLFAVAVIFGAVLFSEASGSETERVRRPIGLISWLTSGNWPAKIGGGLLVVGVGSLLRYALLNFDVAPSIKLGTGIAASAVLALASALTRMGPARRAVSLALAGAAFGIAYLTAYSAFALFEYVANPTGIALLALTAVGAGVYAVTRGALSLALLAMVGAYLAPAFTVGDPGPKVVYSYYAAASILTLLMVAIRDWRPLIHLSFLFTLAGAVFFAWTAQYYTPDHADVMLPAILILTAIHVAMPLAERSSKRGLWLERLDLIYLLAVPAVAAVLALVVAPSRGSLSTELLALSVIWVGAAGYLWWASRDGLALHAVIAVLLAGFGVAARYRNLPWELIALAFSVGALWLAARRSSSRTLHSALAGLVPLLGLLHIVSTLSPIVGSAVFLNGRFVERLIGAGLLMLAGHICRSIRQGLDTLLWTVGIGWALIAIGSELARWDLVSLALMVHWAFVLAAMVLAVWGSRSRATSHSLVVVALGIVVTSSWAALDAPLSISLAGLAAAPLTMIWLAIRRGEPDASTRTGRLLSAVLAPIAAGVWATHVGQIAGIHAPQFALSAAAGTALLVLIAGRAVPTRSHDWIEAVAELGSFAFALLLLAITVFGIGRSGWAVGLELLCLSGLIFVMFTEPKQAESQKWLKPACAIGTALVVQANLLRWLGPPGHLDIGDISRMRLPTLVSLLWAIMGGALTMWGRQRAVRSLWIAGASLLVGAAIKLILVDFGSLGQLANILAVIAAGIVFLLVGWLAPIPPAAPETVKKPSPEQETPRRDAAPPPVTPPPTAQSPSAPPPGPAAGISMPNSYWERNTSSSGAAASADPRGNSDRKLAWTIAILAGLILPLAHCTRSTRESVRKLVAPVQTQPAPPLEIPAPEPLPAPTQPGAAEVEMTSIPQIENECTQWAARLPQDYEIYAAGDYKGRPLDFTIDQSNSRAGAFEVAVHLPNRNVVLILGAYEPAIWTVKWSRDTHIVGVWLSGYHTQKITGLEAGTPLLSTSYSDGGACAYFYIGGEGSQAMPRMVAQVLGRGPQTLVMASAGRINIGDTDRNSYYVQGDTESLDSFRDPSTPFAGDKGIDQLIREGKMRRARDGDLAAWQAMNGVRSGTSVRFGMHDPRGGGELFRTYVVLRPMTFPADLYGGNSATFIVPRGIEHPGGNPGHSQVLDMNP